MSPTTENTACEQGILLQVIERELERLLTAPQSPFEKLYEAARYAALGGGKRLRPLLCLLTAEMYNVSLDTAIQMACAIEIIHTYSLIHDDLPAMDNDDFRRGKPTVHRHYSEAHAILTGDYLLTYAFEVICNIPDTTADVRNRLIKLIAQNIGANGMVGGQTLDVQASGLPLKLEQLEAIHQHKTGRLIQACLLAGAMLGDASVKELKILASVGDHLGTAFQIIDDLLDHDNIAKKRSSDAANHKSTYATLLGPKKARECALKHLEQLSHELQQLPRDTQSLLQLAQTMIHRNA